MSHRDLYARWFLAALAANLRNHTLSKAQLVAQTRRDAEVTCAALIEDLAKLPDEAPVAVE